jgi:hypothetical protein
VSSSAAACAVTGSGSAAETPLPVARGRSSSVVKTQLPPMPSFATQPAAEDPEEEEDEATTDDGFKFDQDDTQILDDFYFHPLAPVDQFNFDLFLCDQRYAEGIMFVNWLAVARTVVQRLQSVHQSWLRALEMSWRQRCAERRLRYLRFHESVPSSLPPSSAASAASAPASASATGAVLEVDPAQPVVGEDGIRRVSEPLSSDDETEASCDASATASTSSSGAAHTSTPLGTATDNSSPAAATPDPDAATEDSPAAPPAPRDWFLFRWFKALKPSSSSSGGNSSSSTSGQSCARVFFVCSRRHCRVLVKIDLCILSVVWWVH